MVSWFAWLLCACVVEAVRFNDRLLLKKPMKTTGQVLEFLSLSKRQNIPGMGRNIPMIRGENGPVSTLLNIKESDSDARAAVKGLTSYDGDLVMPRGSMAPGGYPVSLNIDKDPDDTERGDGPLFRLFPKDTNPIRKHMGGKSDEEKTEDEEKKKATEEKEKAEEKKKKVEEEKKRMDEEDKKKEIHELAEKLRKEEIEKKKIEAEVRLKVVEEIRKLDGERRRREDEIKRKEYDRKKNAEERKKREDDMKRKEGDRKKKEEERKKKEAEDEDTQRKEDEKIKAQNKVDASNRNAEGGNVPRDKSFICYLPKIVVITRMIGPTVINEVKVYGDSHNEKSVHKFISTHVVSANASELINEFTLPPQFILGVAPEVERNNDVSITKTAAYTNNGQLNVPGVIIKRPIAQGPRVVYRPRIVPVTQVPGLPPPVPKSPRLPPLRNLNYGPHFTTMQPTPHPLVPTYNPFLPTTTPRTTQSTSTRLTTTSTTSTTTPSQTSSTTTTTTTTADPAAKTSTSKPWNIDIISDIIAKKSRVKSKEDAKRILEWLNYIARHRNPVNDVPAGDANAFTGYEPVPPNISI